ncbi:serine/threonine-protein kinase CTR1-like isoform X1 [Cucurbita pepo subsp. pepo]|uniref:serine/threonine-protein kinase CTR1-like isoform X1 n=1 Tax=Cucurbita pepo subsp. pepo TaxID=3664 RepID=UPI000C9D9263|nr:serine/threonine-protein kinase CTR1-like isoform X1 [Cucurbita pepo subsp. pepo]XP_023535597.1 serine/threonine-protein kinase CTR1-like isoform X1 [Cucurbita pepo subsp. pepo]
MNNVRKENNQQSRPNPWVSQNSSEVNLQLRGTSQSRRYSPSLCDCVGMGSNVSTSRRPRSSEMLELKVAELERELLKQKEIQLMFKKRMDRAQDSLKCFLEKAQDHGFLHLIIGNRDNVDGDGSPNCIQSAASSPAVPSPSHPFADLQPLIEQAKLHGWYIEPHEIELREKIGQGTTANIYKATWRGLDVAVKCLNQDFFCSNECGVSYFAQELETLCRQRHRFVLQLMGACLQPPGCGWVVTECLRMTLQEWLHGPGKRQKERAIPLPPFRERLLKALEISQGMQYLHEQKPRVIHRDLKPSNIFLDDALHVRVADFGHARFLHDREMALTGETGTYVYMAPEVIRCEPYTEKSDVYSFGIILNELIIGKYPYIEIDYSPFKIAMEVGEGKLRPELPVDENGDLKELLDLICACWNGNAADRPSFATITARLRKIQN